MQVCLIMRQPYPLSILNWVIEMMDRTVGTTVFVRFRPIDELLCD